MAPAGAGRSKGAGKKSFVGERGSKIGSKEDDKYAAELLVKMVPTRAQDW